MLEDIAAMVFVLCVPVSLSVLFRKEPEGKETVGGMFVRSAALLSIAIAAFLLYDCHTQGEQARKQLSDARRQIQQLQGR